MENDGLRGAGNDGDLGKSGSNGGAEGWGNDRGGGMGTADGEDCSLGRSNCDGIVRDTDLRDFGSGSGIGAGDGTACNLEGIGSNVGVEKCTSEGSKKSCVNGSWSKRNGSSAVDCILEEPEGNGGGTGDGTAKDRDVAAKVCRLAGPGSNGNDTNCRKGRKAVAPWRFQIGYKPSFSKAFCSNSGSLGPLETLEYRVQGSSTQCTPATRSTVRCYSSAHSSVRVSAMRDFSVKGEKETSTAYKRKTDKNDHNQVMPNGSFQCQ